MQMQMPKNAEDEEPKEKIIYYVTDEQQQSQYINMFKAGKDGCGYFDTQH